MKVSLLDYGAGNVRSVRNAIIAVGYDIIDIHEPSQILEAEVIIFPGVGSYGTAMKVLHEKGYVEPLKEYLKDGNRPFLGICLGMQTLFESSEEISYHMEYDQKTESDEVKEDSNNHMITGLGIIPGKVIKFNETTMKVPHIGWNGRILHQNNSPVFRYVNENEYVYFVHSYYAPITSSNQDYILTSTSYHGQSFISSIQKKNIVATQFHPEKSGPTGLNILKGFLEVRTCTINKNKYKIVFSQTATTYNVTMSKLFVYCHLFLFVEIVWMFLLFIYLFDTQGAANGTLCQTETIEGMDTNRTTQLTKRIVVALDVRTNDDGELVVTKGDQYDVREKQSDTTNETTNDTMINNKKGNVRNLGQPVDLASKYYHDNIDEIAFLNITSFRNGVIDDMPMLHILENASKNIFVPLTVGGGIRSYHDPVSNKTYSALEVAARYFRAGADKVRSKKKKWKKLMEQ
jgi:imidazole glycerol-phosphate synthase